MVILAFRNLDPSLYVVINYQIAQIDYVLVGCDHLA